MSASTEDRKPSCRFVASDHPRVLGGRHTEECDGKQVGWKPSRLWHPPLAIPNCKGCQPCTEAHCIVCGIEHVDQRTCPDCITATREDLHQVLDLTGRLGDEAEHHPDDEIPGGNATVMVGPYSLGSQADSHEHESEADPPHPLLTLATWEDDWRKTFGQPAAGPASVVAAVVYLGRWLHHAAQHHDAYDDFAREVGQLRSRLEDVLRDGERDERAAPCPKCKVNLVRKAKPRRRVRYCPGHGPLTTCPIPQQGCCDSGGLADEWSCPRCKKTFSKKDYHNIVAATYRAHAPALTAREIHQQYGVKPGSVRGWASLGKVRRRGRNIHGLQLYDVDDVQRHAERPNQGKSTASTPGPCTVATASEDSV